MGPRHNRYSEAANCLEAETRNMHHCDVLARRVSAPFTTPPTCITQLPPRIASTAAHVRVSNRLLCFA